MRKPTHVYATDCAFILIHTARNGEAYTRAIEGMHKLATDEALSEAERVCLIDLANCMTRMQKRMEDETHNR